MSIFCRGEKSLSTLKGCIFFFYCILGFYKALPPVRLHAMDFIFFWREAFENLLRQVRPKVLRIYNNKGRRKRQRQTETIEDELRLPYFMT